MMLGQLALCATVTLAGFFSACGQPEGQPSREAEDAPTSSDTLARVSDAGSTSHMDRVTGASVSYGCADEYRFVATIEDGGQSVRLLLPETTLTLPHVVSASGARFSEAGYTFWSKGQEALLETPERSFDGCISDEGGPGWREAKARGVRFRALGQEPGWIVDIHEADSITVLADYGENLHRFPSVQPEVDRGAGRTVYRTVAGGHRATIVIQDEPCRDAMSGWPYEATVTLTLDGREYRGCGRWL